MRLDDDIAGVKKKWMRMEESVTFSVNVSNEETKVRKRSTHGKGMKSLLDGVKHITDVLRVCRTREMLVDGLVRILVQPFEHASNKLLCF